MSYTVENITSKEVMTKFGKKPAYSIRANGEWFNYGFKKPPFAIGDEVDFQFTENSYGKNVDLASLRTISKGSGAPAPVSAPTSPSKPSYGPVAKVFPIPPLHGDRAIVRQNSITNATKAVVDITAMFADKKNPVLFDELAETIISMARKFEAYSCGDLDAERAEELVEE